MNNEQAHRIAELTIEFIESLETFHEYSVRANSIKANHGGFRVALAAEQAALAEESVAKGVMLEIIDAVKAVHGG
jgi:hypothetical protein